MYWWHIAAELTREAKLQRFGLITTSSIRQTFNRRVLETHLRAKKNPLALALAIPDHPWVDTTDGAAVRIAITVGTPEDASGRSGRVLILRSENNLSEGEVACTFHEKKGLIHSDLRAGIALSSTRAIIANGNLAFTGMYPLGQGFIILPYQRAEAVGPDTNVEEVLKPFVIARDLTQKTRNAFVIDFYPRDMETASREYPALFQWVIDRVKPERDQNADRHIREHWWLHARPRPEFRAAVAGLNRFLVVPRTAKWFSF